MAHAGQDQQPDEDRLFFRERNAWDYAEAASVTLGYSLGVGIGVFVISSAVFNGAQFGAFSSPESAYTFNVDAEAAARIFLPMCIFVGLQFTFERAVRKTYPASGPFAGMVTFITALFVSLGAQLILHLFTKTVNTRYYCIDVAFFVFGFIPAFLAIEWRIRGRFTKNRNGLIVARSYGHAGHAVPLTVSAAIVLFYALYLVPSFHAIKSDGWKIAICAAHPAIFHLLELLWKTYLKTIHFSDDRAMESSTRSFPVKSFSAFARRFLLLRFITSRARIAALLASSSVDAIFRCFAIDMEVRAAPRKRKLEGCQLRRQRMLWMSSAVQSSVAELSAAFASTMYFILLQDHKETFAFPYDPKRAISMVPLFVNLLLAIYIELVIICAVTYSAAQRGVPFSYFKYLKSPLWLPFHIFSCSASAFCILLSTLRTPIFTLCSFNTLCACADEQAEFADYLCSASNATWVKVRSESQSTNFFEGVKIADVLITVCGGIAMIFIIRASVLMARQRRKQELLHAIQEEVDALKDEFDEKTKAAVEAQMEADKEKAKYIALLPYKIPHEHVNFEKRIGHGAYGDVWKGSCRGQDVAIKKISTINKERIEAFQRECNLMAEIQHNGFAHPNLVQMRFCSWDRELLLILEYCELGALDDALDAEAKLAGEQRGMTWSGALLNIVKDIAIGMDFLHSLDPPVLHRDLKPANVLVSGAKESLPFEGWTCKLSDFGESRRMDDDANLSMKGTPLYTSPEVIKMEPYDRTADIYSFGMLLLHVANYREGGLIKLWHGHFTLTKVVIRRRPTIPGNLPLWLDSLIRACWRDDPEKRPKSFAQILEGIAQVEENTKTPKPAESFHGEDYAEEEEEEESPNSNILKIFSHGIADNDTVNSKRLERRSSKRMLKDIQKRERITVRELLINKKFEVALNDLWMRMTHLFRLFGVAVIISILLTVGMIFWSSSGEFIADRVVVNGIILDGFVSLDVKFLGTWGFLYPFWWALAGAFATNAKHIEMPMIGGNAGAICSILAFSLAFVPLYVSIAALSENKNVKFRYHAYEMLVMGAFFYIAVILFGALTLCYHTKYLKKPLPDIFKKKKKSKDAEKKDLGVTMGLAATVLANGILILVYPMCTYSFSPFLFFPTHPLTASILSFSSHIADILFLVDDHAILSFAHRSSSVARTGRGNAEGHISKNYGNIPQPKKRGPFSGATPRKFVSLKAAHVLFQKIHVIERRKPKAHICRYNFQQCRRSAYEKLSCRDGFIYAASFGKFQAHKGRAEAPAPRMDGGYQFIRHLRNCSHHTIIACVHYARAP